MSRAWWAGLCLMLSTGLGCGPELPEAESAAAEVYVRRCSGCHRVYHPGLLTAQMWDFMLTRMDDELRRLGRPPLQGHERQTVRAYLHKHSGG